jgi:DNA-binding transcriptional LysR family regulator
MFDWDDVKFFVAVAEHGSTIAAAKALEVNQSTVQRRVAELERRLGLNLVRRTSTGYALTEAGIGLLSRAQALGEGARLLQVEIDRIKDDLRGVVRLTCPEPVVGRLSAVGLLNRLADRHPQIELQYVISDQYVDLSAGEADIALRSGEPRDETLVGRKVADSIWAIYASKSYLQQHGSPQTIADLSRHSIVGFNGAMANHRATSWLREVAPAARIVSSNDSVLGVMLSVKAGLGIAPLPTTIANTQGDLVEVLPPVEALQRAWYLLFTPDARKRPRVTAVIDFLLEELASLREVLMG